MNNDKMNRLLSKPLTNMMLTTRDLEQLDSSSSTGSRTPSTPRSTSYISFEDSIEGPPSSNSSGDSHKLTLPSPPPHGEKELRRRAEARIKAQHEAISKKQADAIKRAKEKQREARRQHLEATQAEAKRKAEEALRKKNRLGLRSAIALLRTHRSKLEKPVYKKLVEVVGKWMKQGIVPSGEYSFLTAASADGLQKFNSDWLMQTLYGR